MVIRGTDNDVTNAKNYIQNLVGNDTSSGMNQSHGNGNPQSSGEQSSVMEIDSTKVGIVIGRGGCKIKEIESRFQVHMKIGK